MDFSGGSEMTVADGPTTIENPESESRRVHEPRFPVTVDRDRDSLLTDFGRETLNDRYLLPGESYQDIFARVAAAYADDAEHAQRVYDYISKRSEEHTSELQSLMRISYAAFCFKKKTT